MCNAFYLGSEEAFSKMNARVQLCFELADPSFLALSAVQQGMSANCVLAGVGRDRALHLFKRPPAVGVLSPLQGRGPLQPPAPAYFGATPAGIVVALDGQPAWRVPVWSEPDWIGPEQGFSSPSRPATTCGCGTEHPVSLFSGCILFGQSAAGHGYAFALCGWARVLDDVSKRMVAEVQALRSRVAGRRGLGRSRDEARRQRRFLEGHRTHREGRLQTAGSERGKT